MTFAPLSAANLVQTFVPSTFLAKTRGLNLQIWSSEMWHGTKCSRSSSPMRWAESCQSVPIWFTGEKTKMVCKDVRNTLVLPACSINPSHGIMLHWSTCRHDSHFGQKFCGIKEWMYAPLLSHFDLSFLHHFVLHIHWKMQTFLPQTASLWRANKIKVICWQERYSPEQWSLSKVLAATIGDCNVFEHDIAEKKSSGTSTLKAARYQSLNIHSEESEGEGVHNINLHVKLLSPALYRWDGHLLERRCSNSLTVTIESGRKKTPALLSSENSSSNCWTTTISKHHGARHFVTIRASHSNCWRCCICRVYK